MIQVIVVDSDGTEHPLNMEALMEPFAPLVLTPTEREPELEPPPKPPRTRAPKGIALKTTVTRTVVKELTFLASDLKRLLRLPADAELELREDDGKVSLLASWTSTG